MVGTADNSGTGDAKDTRDAATLEERVARLEGIVDQLSTMADDQMASIGRELEELRPLRSDMDAIQAIVNARSSN